MNKQDDYQDKYFVTDDTALAAYLYLNGMRFIEATLVNADNPRRKKYIVYDSHLREQFVDEFYARSTHVIPLEYYEARVKVMRYLKVTVKDPRR